MFDDFCSIFFGNHIPNEYELTFALIFLMLIFHGLSGIIKTLKNGLR